MTGDMLDFYSDEYAMCESPIEQRFFEAAGRFFGFCCGWVPQHRVGQYRLDFAWPKYRVAVECDGHRWHSSSKAQARDARRDRRLCADGWTVLRFAGREILESPLSVVHEVADALARAEKSQG